MSAALWIWFVFHAVAFAALYLHDQGNKFLMVLIAAAWLFGDLLLRFDHENLFFALNMIPVTITMLNCLLVAVQPPRHNTDSMIHLMLAQTVIRLSITTACWYLA